MQPWPPSWGPCPSPGEKRLPSLQAIWWGFILEHEGSPGSGHVKTDRPFWVWEGEGRAGQKWNRFSFLLAFPSLTLSCSCYTRQVQSVLRTQALRGAPESEAEQASCWWVWGKLQRQLGGKRNQCRHTCLGPLFLCRSGSHPSGTSWIVLIISILW